MALVTSLGRLANVTHKRQAPMWMRLIAYAVVGNQRSLTVSQAVVFPEGESVPEAIGVCWFRQAFD